jgi:hypothetical protein
MKAFQIMGEMDISEMMELGKCDDKRVYEIVSGLVWAKIIMKRSKKGRYRYCGAIANPPLELDELAQLRASLTEQREGEAKQLEELRRRVAQKKEMKARAEAEEDAQ